MIFIGGPDCEPIVRGAGLNFVSYCEDEFPVGSVDKAYSPVAKLHGLEVVRLSISRFSGAIFEAAAQHLPQTLIEVVLKP